MFSIFSDKITAKKDIYNGRIPVRVFPAETLPNSAYSAEKLFVMTDIHGSSKAMYRLLSQRPNNARLVFLGDAVLFLIQPRTFEQ